jgi:hypothetical protein
MPELLCMLGLAKKGVSVQFLPFTLLFFDHHGSFTQPGGPGLIILNPSALASKTSSYRSRPTYKVQQLWQFKSYKLLCGVHSVSLLAS